MPKESIPMLEDPSEVPLPSYLAEYLTDFGRLEIGPKLDQFSMQLTLIHDLKDADIFAQVGLGSLSLASNIIGFLGVNGVGGDVKYQGVRGYDPERVRKTTLSSCCPQEMNELPSEIFGTCDMGEYGSGGLSDLFDPCHEQQGSKAEPSLVCDRSLELGHFNSARLIDAESRQYAQDPAIIALFEDFQQFRQRGIFGHLAWCRAARSIEVCYLVSERLEGVVGACLLKLAVHAACTMERVQSRALTAAKATIILFQLSRELGFVLGRILFDNSPSKTLATIISLLIDTGFSFISAGLCLLFTQQQDEGYSRLMFGLAEHCGCTLTSAGRLNPMKPLWKKLANDCIRLSNFCPSRANVVVELHPSEMFHLIARCEHISTDRRLHKTCDDSCRQAQSKENYQTPGHLNEGCTSTCPTKDFKVLETSELVLFDTVKQELMVPKSHIPPYMAISHVWFQGIIGQESRSCGQCILSFLRTTCANIGVRYVWIDTLCMPSKKFQSLQDEVIAKLGDIYLEAKATLVVDIGLISTTATTVLDLSLAILLSDWSSRVWTLQEGVLASKLLFCVGDQVLALPQVYCSNMLLDTRARVPSMLLQTYGMRSRGVGQSLENVINSAAGRQTSWPQDYLVGLSALLEHPPKQREDLHLVAREVARMYYDVDLGILLAPFPRCDIENYRWMPRRAKHKSGGYHTSHRGRITLDGLRCDIGALIKITSIVDDDHTWGTNKLKLRMNLEAEIPIKNWYTTEVQGVIVGTDSEASDLIFCLVGHTEDQHSFGFVVSPADNGSFQYVGCAGLIGKVPAKPVSILVT